ncbi:DNA-directed DNA polymerase [Coemansia aciculifera]|uniref:DNA-directed DNA polymerase n=1 Tax=Coemansia aciculifera TaxID=417176 RepID=A0A9W8IQV3_9FUNG|nr:DNA-directed DNA polymerase [Coemansia aciculifera]
MSTTLDFYWGLASLDEDKRLDAATGLINVLCKFQAERPSSQEQAQTEADLDRICASDVTYAVKRLVKGLASPRDGARQGYSIALSELLSRINCISVKVILDLLWKYTMATKSMKGQEQRDMRFGRIFGLMALLQSGIVARPGTTSVEIRKIVGELSAIGAKKSYLREIAYVTLASMVPMLSGFGFRDELITMFVAVALDKGAIETPDELYLAMKLRSQYPEYDWHSAFPQWQGKHMFAEKNVGKLVSILCETSEENTALFSSWHPQLHIVWDEVFDLYYNKERAAEVVEGKVMEFETLWDTVVERGLFAAGASQFRRYWGFLLVERLLPYLSESTVPAMMSPNIVRALSDNISLAQKSPLAKVSMRAAERLVEICEHNSKVGLAVLTHLLNQKSTIQAAGGKQTSLRTMMAGRIVAKLDGEAIVGYVSYLQEIFLQPSRAHGRDGVADPVAAINVSDKSVERQRAWAVDQMIRVARFDQVSVSEDVSCSVVAFVVAQAAFQSGDDGSNTKVVMAVPQLSATTRDYCATAVVGVVGDVGRGGQADAWATQAVAAVLDGAARRRCVVVLPGFRESRPVLTDALRTLRMLETKTKAWTGTPNAARARALAQLVGNVAVLAAFSGNPQARAEYGEGVPELIECCEKMVAQLDAPAATPRKRTTRSSAAVDEPRPVEVLTDVLIGFLTRDSHALRKLCEHVFAPFADLATPAAIDAIIGVLQAKEGVAGEEGGGIDAQMEMDVDEDEDMEEDEDEDEELGGDVDEELRRKIHEALGSAAEAEVEGEEEVFDDEQMTVFDDKLAEIFAQKKQQKTAERDLRISFVNFKLRVLDLADVFWSRVPESPLVLRLLRALIDLSRATRRDARSKPIHDRAMALLTARRAKVPAAIEAAEGLQLLAHVHDCARRASDKAELRALSAASALATRSLLDAGGVEAKVEAQYAATVADFMTRQASQIHADFFRVASSKLRPAQLPLLWRVAAKAVREFAHPRQALNVFRQVQAYALADVVANSAPLLVAEVAAKEAQELAADLLKALRDALLDTMTFAASGQNQVAATETAPAKLILDKTRLREIIEITMSVARRCLRYDVLAAQDALPNKEDAQWMAALNALAASDNFKSPIITRLCTTLASISSKPNANKRKQSEPKEEAEAETEDEDL